MPEIASQQTPAVTGASATPNEQDPNLAVKPGTESAPVQSITADSDPAATPETKLLRELQEQRRKRQLADQEVSYLRGRLEATPQTPVQTAPTPEQIVIPPRPKMENFESPDAYDVAMDAYNDARAEAKFAEKREKERLEEEQRKDRDRITQIDAKYSKNMLAQKELYPDVDESISRIGRYLDPQMQIIIKKSDIPAALLTHLDANSQELQRLLALDPVDKALEMGQLVASIKAKDKPQGDVRIVSQAPDPLKVPSTSGPPQTVEYDKMTDADFFAMEKKKREEQFAKMAASR